MRIKTLERELNREAYQGERQAPLPTTPPLA
jgi:hypothetical protein